MSVDRPSSVADHEILAKTQSSSDHESVDERLRRLKEEVLPFYPFLLTVPIDVPFRLGSRFVNNWAVGPNGPFAPDEQQLQYMTFLTHHEGDSLLVAVGDWLDRSEDAMPEQLSRSQSAANTPPTGAAASTKKKISLNDYKNKRKTDNSGSGSSFPKNADRNTSTLQLSNEKQQVSKMSPAGSSTQDHPNAPSSFNSSVRPTIESPERKRALEPEDEHPPPHEANHLEMRSPKRKRVSPEKTENTNTSPSKNSSNGLPTLLSPTLPPNPTSPTLPRLLSPTLPPDIEKELAKFREETPIRGLSQKRNVANSSANSKDETTKVKTSSVRKSQQGPSRGVDKQNCSKQPHTADSNGTGPNPNDYDHSERSLHPHTTERPPPSSLLQNATPRSSTPALDSKTRPHTDSDRSQLIVRLKYGRPNRKRVEALLRFSGKGRTAARSPQPKGLTHRVADRDKEDGRSRRNLGTDHQTVNPPKGRAKGDEIVAPAGERSKESKHPASSTESKASVTRPSSSTSVQHQQERTKTTPVKDHNASHRSEHGDDGKTPPSRQGSKCTPGNSELVSRSPPPRPEDQALRSRSYERRAWRDESQKFLNLGRELKHAADRHTAKDNVSASDRKLAAVTAIEAILCFILAFVTGDQSKALARQTGESSNWLSILAYWRVVKKNSASYQQLYDLCLLLGAVSYDSIHALDLERLAVSAIPGDHTPLPTPGSNENATTDDSKKSRKEFFELKTRLPENYKESKRLWTDGTRGFSEDVLTREFPVTWSNRSTNYSELGIQRLKVGQYSGSYFLPFSRATTPLEVVRFGWSILNEWCVREGVNWDGRLGL